MNKSKILAIGDYVLATKYSDGDPCDQWYVGFFSGRIGSRYLVVDGDGNLTRHGGYRRCEQISRCIGDILVEARHNIVATGLSLWYWRYHPEQLKAWLYAMRLMLWAP